MAVIPTDGMTRTCGSCGRPVEALVALEHEHFDSSRGIRRRHSLGTTANYGCTRCGTYFEIASVSRVGLFFLLGVAALGLSGKLFLDGLRPVGLIFLVLGSAAVGRAAWWAYAAYKNPARRS
jgi:DNA-directed RNA polymerase subunit RPC12/RpoP